MSNQNNNPRCLQYVLAVTAALAAEKAAELASAIKAAGIKAGGRVGIYAPNVPNWMLVIQACNRSSLQVGKPALDNTLPFSDLK